MILLRPPHTTDVTQGEDVHGFGLVKPAYNSWKNALVNKRLADFHNAMKQNASVQFVDLQLSDMMGLICEPWQHALSKANVLKAWELIGVSPFTRCVETQLLKKEAMVNASNEAQRARSQTPMLWDDRRLLKG